MRNRGPNNFKNEMVFVELVINILVTKQLRTQGAVGIIVDLDNIKRIFE